MGVGVWYTFVLWIGWDCNVEYGCDDVMRILNILFRFWRVISSGSDIVETHYTLIRKTNIFILDFLIQKDFVIG
jgi:hypothetical protein